MMSLFKFADRTVCNSENDVFIARVDPAISDTDELLRSLYYLLWFPGYFGLNWNSLYDCLRDFSWIGENKIIIVHETLPNLPGDELRIYLEVLKDSVLDWRNDDRHQLEVVFNEKDKKIIENLLSSC